MIKQTNSVQAKHAPLLSLFLNGYENMRQKMDAPCRRPLLEIAPLVFGKWYYAALAKETILSLPISLHWICKRIPMQKSNMRIL